MYKSHRVKWIYVLYILFVTLKKIIYVHTDIQHSSICNRWESKSIDMYGVEEERRRVYIQYIGPEQLMADEEEEAVKNEGETGSIRIYHAL